jgi:hypothetical protein
VNTPQVAQLAIESFIQVIQGACPVAVFGVAFAGGAPPLASLSVTGGVPMLVSDPEPSWLHPDNKQR